MARSGRLVRTLGILCLIAVIAACSNGAKDGALNLEGQTAEQIYQSGDALLQRGKAKEAAKHFSEIERLYPYSQWAKRGLIMSAFAWHQAEEYEEARSSAQRFIDFYPADNDAAYAQYLLALSYYDQIEKIGRDQGLTFKALQELRVVIERYPDSEYAGTARLKFDLAFDHLAAKEMEIGRFYLKRRHYTSAIKRFRSVVEDFQTTSHTPEALHRLVESYLALGLVQEAQTAAAILGYNFRASPFYDDSFRLLSDQGLAPEANSTGWLKSIWRRTVKGEWL